MSVVIRLLLDENLSPELASRLADVFPGTMHVRDVGLKTAPDSAVWAYAASNGLIIVSKDSDFRQRSLLRGAPPKVIALLLGNCSTTRIESVIRSSAEMIGAFAGDQTAALLELP